MKTRKEINQLKKLVSFGNSKLPKSTSIFNMNSATDCPSKKLGLCKLCKYGKDKKNICYALKSEVQYPDCLPYRRRQEKYFDSIPVNKFIDNYVDMINSKRNKVTELRISEAGDFKTQNSVDKIIKLANYIHKNKNIQSYVYTANDTLNFKNRQNLIVIGSNKMYDKQFIAVPDPIKAQKIDRDKGIKSLICKGDCKICTYCPNAKLKNVIIYVKIH